MLKRRLQFIFPFLACSQIISAVEPQNTKRPGPFFGGNPAVHLFRPVVFCPRLTTGLALSLLFSTFSISPVCTNVQFDSTVLGFKQRLDQLKNIVYVNKYVDFTRFTGREDPGLEI